MNKKIYKILFILLQIGILFVIYLKYSSFNQTERIFLKKENSIENKKDNSQSNRYSYLKKYPFLLDCRNDSDKKWSKWQIKDLPIQQEKSYIKPAPKITHDERISRAVLVYFPIEQTQHFEYEFKWLYKSWIEMQRHEPKKWRTDIVVFIENNEKLLNSNAKFLIDMGCSFSKRRKSKNCKPMCTLLEYTPIKKRNLKELKNDIFNSDYHDFNAKYNYLLDNIDIFNNTEMNLLPFYTMVKKSLQSYGYTDSILMAFDGYEYLNSAGYDYLIRSDMDVFLTPLFSVWLPENCNDFYVGRGGYSNSFNSRRLKNIAKHLNLEYANIPNLGSTWISTPHQFRLIGYLTLFGMAYLTNEEFSQPEREWKLGVQLWPDWHYGVVLLYGQNLLLNHLIGSNQMNIIKFDNYIDFPSDRSESIHSRIHIHVFHGSSLFSKFAFKEGQYDEMNVNDNQINQIKYYALKMALDGKRSKIESFYQELTNETNKKI